MSDYSSQTGVELVERWRSGDDEAANELYRRYVSKLISLIGSRISPALQARVDADDVVQTIFRTLFARVRRGEFHFDNDERFWKLLVTIALNKWRNVVRHHVAEGRTPSRESAASEATVDALLVSRVSQRTTAAESLIFADLMEKVLDRLNDTERQFLLLRIEGQWTQKEIAEKLNVTDRTVRRIADRVRERAQDLFVEQQGELA